MTICLQAAVYCTEPHRIPVAGQMTHCLFDKTGTLTTDQLTLVGVVNNERGSTSSSNDRDAKELQPTAKATTDVAVVFAGCHSLLEVDGKVQGDPIETAAVKAVRWQYSPRDHRATPIPVLKKPDTHALTDAKQKGMQGSSRVYLRDSLLTDHYFAVGTKPVQPTSQLPAHLANMSVEIVHRHRFSSRLQRMATIV